jgi:hypothetical protein
MKRSFLGPEFGPTFLDFETLEMRPGLTGPPIPTLRIASSQPNVQNLRRVALRPVQLQALLEALQAQLQEGPLPETPKPGQPRPKGWFALASKPGR